MNIYENRQKKNRQKIDKKTDLAQPSINQLTANNPQVPGCVP